MREELPTELDSVAIDEKLAAHAETRQALEKEFSETVSMGTALEDRMQLPDSESGLHPLEQCLNSLHDEKRLWDRAWEDRAQRLGHWQHLDHYQEDVIQVRVTKLWRDTSAERCVTFTVNCDLILVRKGVWQRKSNCDVTQVRRSVTATSNCDVTQVLRGVWQPHQIVTWHKCGEVCDSHSKLWLDTGAVKWELCDSHIKLWRDTDLWH